MTNTSLTKYGFEQTDFDCTIFAKVEDKYIGYVTTNQGIVYPTYWYANGCRHIDQGNHWNLTPIKKPWYETCKFPILAKNMARDGELVLITKYEDSSLWSTYYSISPDRIAPLTNEELNLLIEDTKKCNM